MPNFLIAAQKPSDTMTQPKVPLCLVFMIHREVRDVEKSVKGKVQNRMRETTQRKRHREKNIADLG